MTAQAALQRIYDREGVLTPALVVKEAADPSHELHDRFEWDDTEAARRFRLNQASAIIRKVTVHLERGDRPPAEIRAWVSTYELAGGEPVEETSQYLPVQEVIASDIQRSAWFRALARDWQSLKRRAGDSQEFAAMVLDDIRGQTG